MDEKQNETTAEHFEIFKAECAKWIEIFGLKGWRVVYDHSKYSESDLANMEANIAGRVATLNLEPEWKDTHPVTDWDVKRSAFHEVCELLFSRIRIIAESRFIADDETGEEIHNLIRILENTVWGKF